MKQLLAILTLMTAIGFVVFSQEPLASKHPVVVKRLILTNQTASLGTQSSPIPLFTPDHDGIFRVTAVMQPSGGNNSGCCTYANFAYAGGSTSTVENGSPASPFAYLSKAGSTLSYFTSLDPSNPIPYDLAVVIEEF